MNLLTALRSFALATILLTTLALAACESGDPVDPVPTDNDTAASMTERINEFRVDGGGEELNVDDTLSDIAQEQAEYNAANNINSDSDAGGDTLAVQLTDAGYEHSTVAYIFNNLGESASFNEWKSSGAYTSIMLDPTFTDIGVGTAKPSSGQRRWVVIFASKDVPTNGTVDEMLDVLNDYRVESGAAPFVINDNLAVVAQAQAAHNASIQQNESATGGDSLLEQVEATGYTYGTMMWTLANGGPDTALGFWTDTPTEETNMQSDALTEIGIGVASGGTKQWWVVIYAEPLAP
jgi:uncharacterized protein YkwD